MIHYLNTLTQQVETFSDANENTISEITINDVAHIVAHLPVQNSFFNVALPVGMTPGERMRRANQIYDLANGA